ncbi:MAG: Flp pilus assembly complex ATPase component TadA, partial [Victivallales bacterium]|nr:Flp pilus assembly complex ATPase component TadA [Victivallales bacterium]
MIASFDEEYMFQRMDKVGAVCKDTLCDCQISEKILDKVSSVLVKKFHLLPLRMENDFLVIATDSERAFKVKNIISENVGCPVKLLLTDRDNLKSGIFKHYGIANYQQFNVGAAMSANDASDSDATPLKMKVDQLLRDAADERASDIHLLPFNGGIYVAFRVNGHMRDYTERYGFTFAQAGRVANLVKQKDTSGQANINVTNMPDGGSFYIHAGSEDIFVRFATVPVGSTENEMQKVNLRLLPQGNKRVVLDQIGYADDDLKAIKRTLYKYPTGLFLNSGPTGAGKTTSLYAQMYYVYNLANEPLNVMTIDNPIEIKEPKFTQMQVHYAEAETANLTEKKILKVCLRSDPDMFLYNEIRDEEDARVALE